MIHPKIGELSETINIVEVESPFSIDGTGTIKSTVARNLRAKVEPLGGSVLDATHQKKMSAQDYRIWIRNRDDVTAFQQIVWGTKRLVMTGPPEDFDLWMLLHAQERIIQSI
jgi:head-tail adaptor